VNYVNQTQRYSAASTSHCTASVAVTFNDL